MIGLKRSRETPLAFCVLCAFLLRRSHLHEADDTPSKRGEMTQATRLPLLLTVLLPLVQAARISNLRVPCGSKNDQIIQVVTYSYQPFASILNIPRDVRPPPMKEFQLPV